MFDTSLAPALFEYVAQHLQVLGWPTLCYGVWKFTRLFTSVQGQATKAATQIDQMATNHFVHMEASLKNQDNLLHSMDGSLKTLVERQSPTPKRRG
jgi:hypothetical protein